MTRRSGVRDVAALSGVSIGTVSHYFNHPEKVSNETRRKIASAIADLDFVRNSAAAQLRNGRSELIAHIAPDVSTPSFNAFNDGAITAASLDDFALLVAPTQGDRGLEDLYLSAMEEARVGGMLVASRHQIEDRIAPIRARGTPIVLVGQRATSDTQPSVSSDDTMGGFLVGRHFAELGRRRVAFVGGPLSFHSVVNRYQGLASGVKDSGASVEIIDAEDRSIQEGIEVGTRILNRAQTARPDAIFCVNDMLALGIIHVALATGRAVVPNEIAIAGYDDTPFAVIAPVPLTSVRGAGSKLGDAAVRLLIEEINHLSKRQGSAAPPDNTRHVVLEPELVIRASTGAMK